MITNRKTCHPTAVLAAIRLLLLTSAVRPNAATVMPPDKQHLRSNTICHDSPQLTTLCKPLSPVTGLLPVKPHRSPPHPPQPN